MAEWWNNQQNVSDLAHWLYGNGELETNDALDLFDEPWQWSTEWYALVADRRREKFPEAA